MESATVARWSVKEGETVAAGQTLLEVETQKATSDIPAPAVGVVRRLCVKEGDVVPGNALLCILATTADEPVEVPAPAAATVAPAAEIASPPNPAPEPRGAGGLRASPATRKAARDLGVDLSLVTGTGPAGRITVEDVQAFVASGQDATAGDDWTDLSPARLALVVQMQRSLAEIPQIVITRRLVVTPLLRNAAGLTFTHHLLLRLAAALRAHPALRTVTDGRRTRLLPVGVAVAIDTAAGLVAPVVRESELGSVEAIAQRMTDLQERAGRRALKNDEMKDGPFALTNLGMLGVDFFTPFVFYGQTAVLAVGRAADAPTDAKVAWFSLAVDHRVVDGAEAARFLATLQREISA